MCFCVCEDERRAVVVLYRPTGFPQVMKARQRSEELAELVSGYERSMSSELKERL